MVSAQKREKLSTLLHSLETEDRKWLQQKLMRQDNASLLRDEKGLSDQELPPNPGTGSSTPNRPACGRAGPTPVCGASSCFCATAACAWWKPSPWN